MLVNRRVGVFSDRDLLFLLCSGDGTLSVFHMRKAGLESQSDNMEDELLSVAVLKV